MDFYNALQAVAVVGVSAFLYFKFKNTIVPNIAGFINYVCIYETTASSIYDASKYNT